MSQFLSKISMTRVVALQMMTESQKPDGDLSEGSSYMILSVEWKEMAII